MAHQRSILIVLLITSLVSETYGKPHALNGKKSFKTRSKREEITPQTSYFNPGSEETSRLAFEEQQSEAPNGAGQNEVAQNSNDFFQGQQDLSDLKETAANSNANEAQDLRNRFMAQSEVQRSSMGGLDDNAQNDYPETQYTRTYSSSRDMEDLSKPAYGKEVADALKSYGISSSYHQPEMPMMVRNPFELPAGYPEDGTKKSFVTKQNLPFNEPHPEGKHQHVTDTAILTHENDTWSGVSRYPPTKVMGHSSDAQQPNGNGVVSPPQEGAQVPVNQLGKDVSRGSNATQSAAQQPMNNSEPETYVEYIVPPPSLIFDESKISSSANATSQLPTPEKTASQDQFSQTGQPSLLPAMTEKVSVGVPLAYKPQPVSYPQDTTKQADQKPVSETADVKLEPRPALSAVKIPSAKNYPVNLIWLAESRKTGLQIMKTKEGQHQLVANNQTPSSQQGQTSQNKASNQTGTHVSEQQKSASNSAPQQAAQYPANPQVAQTYIQKQTAQYPGQQVAQYPANPQVAQTYIQKQTAQYPGEQVAQYPAKQQAGQTSNQQQTTQYPAQQVAQYPAKQQAAQTSVQQQTTQYPGQQVAQYPPRPQAAQTTTQQQAAQVTNQQPGQYPAKQQVVQTSAQQQSTQYPGQQIAQYPAQQVTQNAAQPVAQYPAQQQGTQNAPQQQVSQYPASQQAGQNYAQQESNKTSTSPEAPDHAMCTQYPVSRCNEEWIKINCRNRCKGANVTCQTPTVGGNGCCAFPFIYRGQPYTSCILQPGQSYWCSTTLNFDRDGRWGLCGGCPLPPCPTTTTPPYTTTTMTTPVTTTPATTTTQPTTTPATTTTQPTTTPATTTTQPTTTPATTTTQPTTTPATTTTQPTTTPATTTTTTTKPPTTTQMTTTASTPNIPSTKVCGPWSAWTSCDKNCGGGKMHRYRNCTKLVFVDEVEVETQPCNPQPCVIQCENWTQWSECSATCGYGYNQRFRNCVINNVTRIFYDQKQCYVADCPPICGEWTSWSTCSKSCDNGTQRRERNCTLTDGLQSFNLTFFDSRICNTEPCPPDCSQWSSWSSCTKTCGEGTQYRYTNCKLSSGENTTYYDHRVCNTQPCPPVCEQWARWTECTKTCGGGSQHRIRNCSVEDQGKNQSYSEGQLQECNTQPCLPECGMWGRWTECTKTCGGGLQHRVRNCTVDIQGNLNHFSEGEVEECNTQPCLPDFICYDWSPWSECTASCGGGHTTRVKQCMRNGSLEIATEAGVCNVQPCERVCGEWSAFTFCSSPCGGGTAERWRTCDGQIETENITCNLQPCTPSTQPPINITTTPRPPTDITTPAPTVCSEWSEWSVCSATCNGIQTRNRHCKNATHESDQLQARPCNTLPCEAFTTVPPATTPAQNQSTTPSINQTTPSVPPPANQTTPSVVPPTNQTTTAPPTPYPECTEWSQWSECTRTCGGGYQERFRTCQKFEQEVQSRICNVWSCPVPTPVPSTTPKPRPGPFPECLLAYLSFDKIDQERKIVYDEGPYHNDAQLDGNMTFVNGNFSCGYAVRLEGGEILFDGSKFNPKPTVAVTIAAWIFIDSNVQRQTIFATRAGNENSDNFFLEIEQGKIRWYHIHPTENTVFHMVTESLIPAKTWVHVAGTYNRVTGQVRFFVNAEESKVTIGKGPLTTDWDTYAKIAGGGRGTKFRGIIDEFYVFNCSLIDEQIRVVADTCKLREGEECPSPLLGVCPPCDNCTTKPPPTVKPIPEAIDGGYGPWGNWSRCSVTCGIGTRSRHRECNNPEPQFGGLSCEDSDLGPEDEVVRCDAGPCPINGSWSGWGEWSSCSVTCGIGFRTHWRQCDNPRPQFGGSFCVGPDMAQDECVQRPCPINGNYTSWTVWSDCSATCGNGTQTRIRSCANPSPKYNGRDCSSLGPSEEIKDCWKDPCPRDGSWSQWTSWSQCSKTCGDGIMSRERKCDSPTPANGGAYCLGNSTSTLYCKEAECCDIPYKDIGCYRDNGSNPRPLPNLLFTDRDPKDQVYSGIPIHGQDFEDYVMDLICRCAKRAKESRSTHFAIQQYGECYSGPNVAQTYYRQGEENQFRFRPDDKPWVGCMDIDYNKCKRPSLTCIGQEYTNFVYGLENVTAADGNYTQWTGWSDCSATCDEGTQTRTRECTNPKPSFGGRNCSHIGDPIETRPCNLRKCPVAGDWGGWSNWTECSAVCGEGTRQRSRECDSPAPANGGMFCPGSKIQSEICENEPCPVNCSWSQWSQWSGCSVTCGEGIKIRHRSDDEPPALYGGHECVGPAVDVQTCNAEIDCGIDGNYTMWSSWSVCSRTCGGGFKSRWRACTNPSPSKNGKDCTDLGPAFETVECGTAPCRQNGNYSDWSNWSTCDRTCGEGMQQRTRRCDNPAPMNGGKNCSVIGPAIELQRCNLTICPIDGNFTEWTPWSVCSKTCGNGQIHRTRKCENPLPQFGGKFCVGNDSEARICNMGPCCNIKYKDIGCFADKTVAAAAKPLPELLFDDQNNIDKEYWDEYMENVICRCANAAFTKQYTHFALQSLTQCRSGPNVAETYKKDGKSESCVGTGGNPSNGVFKSCSKPNLFCVGADKANYVFGLVNVSSTDGNYTEWSSWTDCSAECGAGTKSRYRSCTNPSPAFGGKDCNHLGDADQTMSCEKMKCPVDGGFSPWTDWTDCSKTCGDGKMYKFRLCNSPEPAYGGRNCSGETTIEQDCHLKPCPVDGNYTEWGEFTRCSTTCGNGTQLRQRTCTNPRPQNGGKSCLEQGMGDDTQERSCNDGPCIIMGNWCEWTPWSLCSKTCGSGVKNRTRDCACPLPRDGGAPCIGSGEETRPCFLVGCPVNGNYTSWTSWTSCDKSCGNGTRTRSRSCNNPAPANGGKTCIEQGLGDDTEDEECFLAHCPVNGNFSDWSPWTPCSKSCGDGLQLRNRTCTNPSPKYGGNDCVGDLTQQKYCKLGECCDVSYKDIGCYADNAGSIRPLPEMLFSDEAKRKSESWDEFLPDLICACAKAAKEKKYSHFGIQNLAECWSGASSKDTYALDGPSEKCLSTVPTNTLNTSRNIDQYEKCLGDNLLCAGKQGANYVYGLENVTVVDGNYTEWSSWSNCSVLCAGGTKTRQRYCTNPRPSFGGKDCSSLGPEINSEICNTNPCPVDGNWGSWSEWSTCSQTCENGTITRTRICDNPIPQHGGEPCEHPETATQTMVCNLGLCPVDCQCMEWGAWSACSVTCGVGNKTRSRNFTQEMYGGKACTCSRFESQHCMPGECPVNGKWGEWSPWNVCSKPCGSGMRNRTRVCDSPEPKFGGQSCNGTKTDNMACNEGACPIDGGYTEWTEWYECSKPCGGGKSQRFRYCTSPIPQNGGRNCSVLGNAEEEIDCNTHWCPQDGGFTEWSPWSSCSALCGEGMQTSNRTCTNPEPKYNGSNCVGETSKARSCKIQECCKTPYKRIGCFQDKKGSSRPLPELLFDASANASQLVGERWNAYLLELVCRCAEVAKAKKYTHIGLQDYAKCYSGPAVAKTYNQDGVSSQCVSSSSTDSTQNSTQKYNKCLSSDAHCAGEADANFVYGLEYTVVDGNYTEWSSWQTCSRSCGIGTTYRMRNCTNPTPAFGGKNCSSIGPDNDVKPCQIVACPVNGSWGPWGSSTACSKTCGNGTASRTRQCDQPAPANGGATCPGNATITFTCNIRPCAINGSWSDWSDFSPCSKTCGEGERQRTRQCNNPAPNEYGSQCEGNSTEVVACNLEPCFGKLTPWGEWSSCSHTCGDGIRSRNRTCEGGDTCAGDLSETEACNIQKCPLNCERKLDLGFVHDTSTSITDSYDKTRTFILSLASSFKISLTATRVAYLQFATNPDDNFKTFNMHDSLKDFEQNIYKKNLGSSSYINRALQIADTSMFNATNGDRPDVADILVILTDGDQSFETRPDLFPTLQLAAKSIKDRGITVIAVAVGPRTNDDNLKLIASSEGHIFKISSFDEIYKLVYNVSLKACEKEGKWSEWTAWSNCSASCGNGTKERTRFCQGGIAGQGSCAGNTTEVTICSNNSCIVPTTPAEPFKCHESIDIAFVVDSSSSITNHWENLRQFLIKVIEPFNIGPDGAMVSLVTYATQPRKVFGFDPKKTKELLKLDLANLQQISGGTRIDLALRFTADNVFGPNHGDRPEVPDVAVVLTDGKSDPGSESLATAAEPLKERGVHVLAVGLGSDIDQAELKTIITNKDYGLFLIQDISEMVKSVGSISREICQSIKRPKPKPVYTGYTCQPSLVYTFDKICEKTVYDESGKGNNAQLIGKAVAKDNADRCKNGMFVAEVGGVKVDGVNMKGKPTTQMTISTWLNMFGLDGVASGHQIFMVKDSSRRAQISLVVMMNGGINITIANENQTLFSASTVPNSVSFFKWHHIAFVFDASTKQSTLYVDGVALTNSQYASIQTDGPEFLSMDWAGLVSIGTDDETKPVNQIKGSVDEFYMFPCVITVDDVKKIKDFCGEYDPFTGPFPGATYKIFSGVTSSTLDPLSSEIQNKNPVFSSTIKHATAPAFADISNSFTTPITDGAFAATISGYFVPPLSGLYKLTIAGHFMARLSFSVEKKSIIQGIEKRLAFDGDTNSIRNASVSVNLQAGAYYYYEILQLSSDQQNKLDFHFKMTCQDGSDLCTSQPIQNTYLQARIPSNCSEIADAYENLPDDEYKIRMQQSCDVVSVYCHYMRSSNRSRRALEYITLPAGGNENYALYYRPRLRDYNTCAGPEIEKPSQTEQYWGQTWFQRIRVNPNNLAVNREDFTFATSIGRQMEYGRAGDCYSNSQEDCRKGKFKINIEGTDLKFKGNLKWMATGTPQDNYRITQFKVSPSNTEVSAHCGGSCSECMPAEHLILVPEVCADTSQVAFDLPPPVSKPISKRSLREKRAKLQNKDKTKWWSWWPFW